MGHCGPTMAIRGTEPAEACLGRVVTGRYDTSEGSWARLRTTRGRTRGRASIAAGERQDSGQAVGSAVREGLGRTRPGNGAGLDGETRCIGGTPIIHVMSSCDVFVQRARNGALQAQWLRLDLALAPTAGVRAARSNAVAVMGGGCMCSAFVDGHRACGCRRDEARPPTGRPGGSRRSTRPAGCCLGGPVGSGVQTPGAP